jgi:hypothetical protein
VSYGAFVQACIEERRALVLRGRPWEDGAARYASEHLPDFPESRVVEVLGELRWPDRRVSLGEVLTAVRGRVSAGELAAWEAEMDSWQPRVRA